MGWLLCNVLPHLLMVGVSHTKLMNVDKAQEITLTKADLNNLLIECARLGAHNAIEDFAHYCLKDACKILNISYPTLNRRILEGKIIDGLITGREIRRYVELDEQN